MQAPRSILVYTDGEVMGDGIIRLPFIAALKRAFPHARITWLASGQSVYETALAPLAAPLIDELIVIPHRALPLADFLLGPKPVRGRRFDLILDGQRQVKRSLWLKRIPHGRFVSAAADYRLSDAVPPGRRRAPRFIDQITALAEAATGVTLGLEPLPLPGPEWEDAARGLLPEGKIHCGFIVGAGHPDKCWPLARFIAVARAQAEAGRVPVLFLGPKEAEWLPELRAALPEALFPLQSGHPLATSPLLTIALGSRLGAALANDSGGAHLLAAGGCKLAVLFRSNTVREKFLPTAPQVIALAPEDFDGAPGRMADIPPDAALAALNDLLS